MRAKKKQAKKHSWKNVFLSLEINLFFFGMFFYLPKLTVFSQKSATIQCARWTEKKHMFFLGNALPKFIARAHLNREKKHSDLMFASYACYVRPPLT